MAPGSTPGEAEFLAPFDLVSRPRLVFGCGAVGRLGELARELGGTRALFVTDPGLVAAGHAGRAEALLAEAGLAVAIYDRVRENPTTLDVDRCVAVARAERVDLIVGFGGGSAMDTAKGCNFILTNGGRMQDYWGVGKATRPMLPLIAVPTTAGTGSECQSFALIADEDTHQKMACGDPKAAAAVALLDPELTTSQPRIVTACTGIDALGHALETAVTRGRNPLSRLFSTEAFRLINPNLERVLADPGDLAARAAMLLGAAYAGTAIELSMLGIAHSLANPLTARHALIHGQAVGLMLPHVIRFNGGDIHIASLYTDLCAAAGLAPAGLDPAQGPHLLAARVERLLAEAGLAGRLADFGVTPEAVPALAKEAVSQWTARFNPRTVGEADLDSLYLAAL